MTCSLTVLGCSASYAAPGGACSGYLIRTAEVAIWVDTGPGTVANLQNHIDLDAVSAIIVSHEHPDHCGEMAVLYNAYKWFVKRTGIPVYGPPGVERVVRASCGDTSDVFDWTLVSTGDVVEIGDVTVTFERTDHSVETLAVRIDHGDKSVVYTADTGPNWDMTRFAGGADILLGEATMLEQDNHPDVPHLSAEELGRRASDAEVSQLIVTHVTPGADVEDHVAEAARYFQGHVEAAVVNRTYPV